MSISEGSRVPRGGRVILQPFQGIMGPKTIIRWFNIIEEFKKVSLEYQNHIDKN